MENSEIKFINSAEKEMEKQEKFIVPESEISEQSSRSSGRGGQNINKRSTKSEVRWNVNETAAFDGEEKERIKQVLGNRINKKGDLIVAVQEERSWFQNKERAVERLNNLIKWALETEKDRIPTEPTRGSKERRVKEKKLRGKIKKLRGKSAQNWSAED